MVKKTKKFNEREHFEKYYKNIKLDAKEFRKRFGCDRCKKETATEAFIGYCGSVLWICEDCIKILIKWGDLHKTGITGSADTIHSEDSGVEE